MSIDSKIGGYPVEWFVQPPSENFKCGVCFDVLKNPHQCKNGHTFCHSCISLTLETHKNCPTCKINLTSDTLCLNLLMRNEIDERFVVKCDHDDIFHSGCEWTGTLEQSIEHFQKCPYRLIPCPLHAVHCCLNKKCTGKIKRQDLREHLFCCGSKRDIVDTMLIMAETIAAQQKEIDLLHNLCLNKKASLQNLKSGGMSFGNLSQDRTKLDGFCVVKNKNGSRYSGHFKDGIHNGFGVNRTKEAVYAGEWENNKYNGHGMFRLPVTDKAVQSRPFINISIGEFKNNMRHGMVTDINAFITTIGSYKNGKLDGNVERLFNNGNKFVGNVLNNGTTSIYSGTYTSSVGDVFVGTVDDTMSYFVQGKLTSTTNGVMYEGNFVDQSNMLRINGTGTITYTNGGVFTGEFKSGSRHGFGNFVNNHGFTRTGQWINNKFTAQQPQEQELICNDDEKTAAVVSNMPENSQKSGMSEKKSTFVVISDFFSPFFTKTDADG